MGKRKAVQVDRLRAAYQARGGSWHQLAKAARVPHPTLSRLVSARGPTKAVSAATLERLAATLQVPAEWLTGERPDLPYVLEWGPRRRKGEGPSRWEQPTADDVRWSWLMQAADAALRRDLGEWYGEQADEAYDSWGRRVLGLFTRLGSSMVWRSVTLEPSPRGGGHDLWQCEESPAETWLKHVLEPWFAGKAYLNADLLRGVLRALVADADVRLLGSDEQDADALRALERYAAARNEFFPGEARYDSGDVGGSGDIPAPPEKRKAKG